jgi:hypothetical protein
MTRRKVKAMKKLLCKAAAAVLALALLAGCSSISEEKASPGTSSVPISGVAQAGQTKAYTATLYFRYSDEYFLTSETRTMEVPSNERVEAVLVRALAKGPSGSNTELAACINPKTRAVSVSDSGEFLFITLSKDFLDPFGDEPQTYTSDPVWTARVHERQRLGLYAIINTLTELGSFSSVQIFVDLDDTGSGQRVKRIQAGLEGDAQEQMLEPQQRQDGIILTAGRALERTLKLLMNKDYTRAYSYLNASSVQPASSAEQLKETVEGSDTALQDFDITGESVSGDGKTAVVTISCILADRSGQNTAMTAVPMRMTRVNECWKLTIEALAHFYAPTKP